MNPLGSKAVDESLAETTHFVLPNDTNTQGNLFGGRLLEWLDITCAISAHRHCKRVSVTVAVNHVSFDRPIKLGDLVTIRANVSRAFNSSMEVWADAGHLRLVAAADDLNELHRTEAEHGILIQRLFGSTSGICLKLLNGIQHVQQPGLVRLSCAHRSVACPGPRRISHKGSVPWWSPGPHDGSAGLRCRGPFG